MARSRNRRDEQPAGFVPAEYHGTYKPRQSNVAGSRSRANGRSSGGSSTDPYSRSSANYASRKPKGSGRGKKVVIALVIIALIAALVALGLFVYKEMQKATLNEQLHNDVTQEELTSIDKELTGTTTFEEPFTVLLLGTDERPDDPEMGVRTDTIVLVRVDPVKNIISMVSIPRDTMIDIPGYGTNKFNAAYTFNGPSGTISAVKELTGVDIDHYAEVNFSNLVGLIDAIGGIDVMVDETIDDEDAGDYVIPAGQQHLNGEQALVFSRSRAYVDGDFTRVSNQRKVIEAIIHKGLEAPATDLYGIINSSVTFLTTDSAMDVDFIYSLADQIRHNDADVTMYSATIPSSDQMVGDVSYVVADPEGVKELMRVFMAGGDITQKAAELSTNVSVPTIVSETTTQPVYEVNDYNTYDSGYNNYYYEEEDTTYEEAGTSPSYDRNYSNYEDDESESGGGSADEASEEEE